jgi:1-deoxy-D-xylulose-5-phosphate reductoisomerase
MDKFKCLGLAYDALEKGKSAPGTLNAANEVAVEAFLNKNIGFLDISTAIEKTLAIAPISTLDTIARVVENDRLSRQITQSVIEQSLL